MQNLKRWNKTKTFISLPTENLKTSTFDSRSPPKNLYEWILEYKVKKFLDQKKKLKKIIKKLTVTLKSVYITVAKFHYFHHRKYRNLHLQPLPPNNPNLFTVFYLRFLDDERFYEKILTRQLCKNHFIAYNFRSFLNCVREKRKIQIIWLMGQIIQSK